MNKIQLFIFLSLFFLLAMSFDENQIDKYKYAEREGRMEGLRKVPYDAYDLDLISFIVYREKFDLQNTRSLKIKFFLENQDKVYITAVSLDSKGKSNYQMKPIKTSYGSGWQEFNSWPVGDVIEPVGIDPNGIGIVAKKRFDRPGSGIIVPVIFYEKNFPEQRENYTAYLLPKNTLSYINFSVIRVDDGEIVCPDKELTNKSANLPFKISFSLRGQKKGIYKIMITTEELGRTIGPDRYYTFYHF